MLGLMEAPPRHALTAEKTSDPSGITFAYRGSGLLASRSQEVHTLAKQVNTFRKNYFQDTTISEKQLSRSVALVAISGNGYASIRGIGQSSLNLILVSTNLSPKLASTLL